MHTDCYLQLCRSIGILMTVDTCFLRFLNVQLVKLSSCAKQVLQVRPVENWAMLIGVSGDWPWLHKSGNLSRSFNNVQKRITVRNAPRGIPLCCGTTRCAI